MVVAIRGVVVGRVEDRELVKFVGISLEVSSKGQGPCFFFW